MKLNEVYFHSLLQNTNLQQAVSIIERNHSQATFLGILILLQDIY